VPRLLLTIVVPAWNEADNLRRYSSELLPVLERLQMPYEVVIVDDGSTDDTRRIAEAMGPAVRVVSHEQNRGLGAAIRTGFAAARGELVVTLDADLTFSPLLIGQLLERFQRGDVDVVTGSPKLAGYGEDIPSYRIVISRVATLVYSTILGTWVTAVSPIFRLYRRDDLNELDLKSVGFDINAEILFALLKKGKRLAEIPAPLTQRIHGQSRLNYRKEIVRHLRLSARMAAWRLGLSR
jgi:dolichol-phosphate mannosyltransferase